MFVCCIHKIGQRCLVLLLILSSIAGLTVVFSKAAGALSATNQVHTGTGRDGGPGTPPTHSQSINSPYAILKNPNKPTHSPTESSTVPPTVTHFHLGPPTSTPQGMLLNFSLQPYVQSMFSVKFSLY